MTVSTTERVVLGMNDMNSMNNSKKELPILYTDRDNCCGCGACYAICPVKAIAMIEDHEGFLYPQVDDAVCIRCYRCVSVCVFKEDQETKGYYNRTR